MAQSQTTTTCEHTRFVCAGEIIHLRIGYKTYNLSYEKLKCVLTPQHPLQQFFHLLIISSRFELHRIKPEPVILNCRCTRTNIPSTTLYHHLQIVTI